MGVEFPQPADAWEGILDATSYGYVCPLLDMGKPGGELMVPHRYWVMDEDCQNLNIWTPACDDKKRPVMVWLHGGGFEAGSAIEQIAYEGENMSRLGGVVVVSINHRLNVLGYCDLSDFGEEYANSGNAGTDDIIAALSWIQKNIAVFTGDPNNGAIPQWKPSTPEEEHTILFSEDTKVVVNHDKELIPLAAKYVGPILAKAMGKAEIQH